MQQAALQPRAQTSITRDDSKLEDIFCKPGEYITGVFGGSESGYVLIITTTGRQFEIEKSYFDEINA